jgi:hypothetical protein
LVAAGSRDLHLAFATDDITKDGGTLIHLRWTGDVWRATQLPAAGVPAYVDLAADEKGQVAIAYVAGRHDATGSYPNTVFLTRSTDRGETWGQHYVVSDPSRSPTYEAKVVIDAQSGVHVLWMRHPPQRLDPDAVWHAATADGGSTWSNFASLPITGLAVRSQVAMDRCGTIHYIVENRRGQYVELAYARLSDGKWTAWQRPFEGTVGAMASMRYDGHNRLLIVWETMRSETVGARQPAILTMRSHLPIQ